MDCTRDTALAKARVINRVEEFKDMMKTDSVTMCLTDRANFQCVLNPDYKATDQSHACQLSYDKLNNG